MWRVVNGLDSAGLDVTFLCIYSAERKFEIQWKPLNVITLGQIKSDMINQMITITD